MVELLRRAAPGLPIHGSTQMSITSPEGAEFARQVRKGRGVGVQGALLSDDVGAHWAVANRNSARSCCTIFTVKSPFARPLAQLGVSRVVVGRELSVRDISRVSAGSAAEVEAFVHGALCVSYSGQVGSGGRCMGCCVRWYASIRWSAV